MLKFLFKRPGDKSAETPADKTNAAGSGSGKGAAANAGTGPGAAAAASSAASTAAARLAQAEQLRAIGTDEAAAAEFLLRSDFSELRLAAAEHIVSRPQLERLHAAIRNTDRRVAKLLQGRIDALRHHEAELARGTACLDQARTLLADDKLSPNQVAELDRRWTVIKAPELDAAFQQLRTALGQRLEAQVALQRAMIDRLAALRQLLAAPADAIAPDEAAARLERMSEEQQAALADPEHSSLPRSLVNEWATEQLRAQALLAALHQGRDALAARAAALDAWQAALDASAAAAAAAQSAVPAAGTALSMDQPAPQDAAPANDAPVASDDADAASLPVNGELGAQPADQTPGEQAVAGGATESVPEQSTAPVPVPQSSSAPASATPAPALDADTLLRDWQRLPAAPAGDAADALQTRFDALLTRLPPPRARARDKNKVRDKVPAAEGKREQGAQGAQKEQGPARTGSDAAAGESAAAAGNRVRPVGGADPAFLDELAAMEAALEQGSLHSAAEHDKALKEREGKGGKSGRLSAAQADRLAHARAELKRLSDWARWGGNVSREELIKAVEQLSTQSLPMAELAKKVGSMRERWKALDTLSGAAPKSLWERFDAACTQAYAPAAAHFKQLAEERHANAARAQVLIAEAQAQAARVQQAGGVEQADEDNAGALAQMNAASAEPIDWKQMAATVQRLRLAWSHLGAIDRKDKKRLDQEFTAALNILQKPLERQRKAEVGHREALIEQVLALDPTERGALDALRAAQEKWQELARALPLERKAEQAVWQRFRAACDAVFARRKETANAADAERRAHQAAKDALSARLEQAAGDGIDAAGARKLLQEVAGSWHGIGAVPRAAEAKVEQRYKAAVAAVQARVDDARRSAAMAQASALRDKLRLCQQLEAALADHLPGEADADADNAGWQARWDALPPLAPTLEKTLAARFRHALAARGQDGARAAYVRTLEANRPILLQEVLRQEIAAGIDSGSDFARDRLKLQVEVLQSSLKSGQKGASESGRFEQLAAMPALVDERTARRIEQLFARVGKDKP